MTDPVQAPDQAPIKNPLKETEAREFIAKQVKTELWGYLRWGLAVIGIVNFLGLVAAAIAIVGMWFTIQNATQTTAVNVATQEANRISHDVVDPIGRLTENTYKEFSDRFSQLEEKRIRLDASLSERETEAKKLQQDISDRDADVNKLKDELLTENANLNAVASNVEGVKNMPTAQLAAVVNSLSKGGLSLLPTLGQIADELNRCYEYGITVVDSGDLGAPSSSFTSVDVQKFSDLISAFEASKSISGKAGKSLGLNVDPDLFNRRTLTWNVDLQKDIPSGAEVVDSWTVPYGNFLGVGSLYLSSKRNPSDPSKITVVCRGADLEDTRFGIYVLYRKHLHVASDAIPQSTINGQTEERH